MDKQQIALKLALDGLGVGFKMDTFDDRLILQKAVYLAQAKGVNLGYYYSWYLYGPYTSALARDAFEIERELGEGFDDSEGWQLDEDCQNLLEKLTGLFREEDRATLALKLELLASVHFIVRRKQVDKVTAEKIRVKLEAFNKNFTEGEIKTALVELKDYGLLSGGRSSQNNR